MGLLRFGSNTFALALEHKLFPAARGVLKELSGFCDFNLNDSAGMLHFFRIESHFLRTPGSRVTGESNPQGGAAIIGEPAWVTRVAPPRHSAPASIAAWRPRLRATHTAHWPDADRAIDGMRRQAVWRSMVRLSTPHGMDFRRCGRIDDP